MSPYSYYRSALVLAELLDSRFRVGRFKFGLDPLISLIPGFGDLIGLFLSLYIVWVGIQMKLPQDKIAQMVRNIILDFFLGVIPIIGDVSDFFYKANLRNIKVLRQYVSVEGNIS